LSIPSSSSGPVALIAGRYRIERAIAEGGMGAVYAVYDERTGRTLALKRAHRIERDEHLMALFEREYRTLASLEHPRIIRVHDYGMDGTAPFYTMDLVQGRDLHELSPAPFAEACLYLRDVGTSLALLHARRLLHRDITPRNVRITPDGRCTLIDFGTLTSFGIPERTVGTPPSMPPEALRGAPLDQRADLFAFGALAYWTLTRKHAYHARTVKELPAAWQRGVVPPSKLVAGIPKQVDTLILSLLNLDPNARPSSIAEVVDRLTAVCNLPPYDERTERALAESYLAHTQLVGRDAELSALCGRIAQLKQGKGSAVTVYGPSGSGRSRVLRELTLQAQLLSVPAILVDGAATSSAYGTAVALLQRVLDASPAAMQKAQAHAAVLAQLDRGIATRLAQQPSAPLSSVSGGWRARAQEALQSVVSAACAAGPLLIAIDNADEADEPSLALLAALCSLTSSNLVLAMSAASCSDRSQRRSLSRRVLEDRSERVELAPLSYADTLQLTSSVFGDAQGCARIANWLHQRSAGLPLHCMALVRKLYALGTVRYEGGLWLLPAELPDAAMADGLDDLLADRLQELSPPARGLAEAMAIQRGSLSRAVCLELAKCEAVNADPLLLLDELLRADVLMDTIEGYRFSHGVMRRLIIERTDQRRARSIHMLCAEQALSVAGREEQVSARITAGWHLLHAGEESRGADLLADVTYDTIGIRFAFADLQIAAPALVAALEVYSRQGRSIYERLPLLTALANAGYYEDRKWAERYGDEALAAVTDVVELELARKLQRKVGKTLGLVAALFVAFVRFKIGAGRSVRYKFVDLLRQLMGVATALTGVAAIALDVERAIRVAAILDPFMHLPERLTPVGIGQVCRALGEIGREHQASALRTWKMLYERFSDPRYYRTLPEYARPLYLGGLSFSRGIFETFRDGQGALQTADLLDATGLKLYRMVASEVRMLYHLNRGEAAQAERHREQVDLHAIQIGSASQFELFEPAMLLLAYTATGDAIAIRQVADRLTKLAETTPSLVRYAKLAGLARTMLPVELLAAGSAESDALREYRPLLRSIRDTFLSEEPRAFIGWAASLGSCARALNLAGMHADALRCCERVREHMREDDREFVAMFLTAEMELAVARAGLGDAVGAHEQLNQLLAFHSASDNPLTRGRIHEACARVAVLLDDRAAFKHHLVETRTWFRTTGSPTLIARAEMLSAYARISSKPPRGSLVPTIATVRPPASASTSGENIVTSAQRQRRITPAPTTGPTTLPPSGDDAPAGPRSEDGAPTRTSSS
jgi:serine/threonine-protein kinase